jgi:acyl-CoA thioesterase FadM
MRAMDPIRVRFTVHSFDADAFGHLSPAALAGYLQEAAGRSAETLGFALGELNRLGLTWVLARSQIVLDAPLRWGDVVEVETWPSGLDRLAALRDFRLLRDGAEVGRALTTWFAIDLATRRPVRPQGFLPAERHAQTAHVLPLGTPPPRAPASPDVDRRFQVRFADIDANLHVTNASYVAWALEAVEEPFWRSSRLAAIDVQFLAECNLGAFVRSRSAGDGAEARLHAIVREADGKEVARARTVWAPRQE